MIVNGIKVLAMDLGIFVVVLSQMSRKADETYHAPTMTYLRDSGAIEAAADQIALLFTGPRAPHEPEGMTTSAAIRSWKSPPTATGRPALSR